MLNDYKEHCKASADLILKNWASMSKNELCRAYIEHEQDTELANAYFSALLYKYWNLIPKFHAQSYNVAEPEEVYNWLVDSISYALKHRRWTDKDSNIYQDNTGPDKVINRRMKCARLTYYQFLNRKKRKQDFDTLSLDQLQEDHNDNLDLIDPNDSLNDASIDLKEFIRECFYKKDYFLAFLLNIICTESVFDNHKFNYKKVVKYLKKIDETYCKGFAYLYDIDEALVLSTLKYFNKNSTNYLMQKIEYYMGILSHSQPFMEVLNAN